MSVLLCGRTRGAQAPDGSKSTAPEHRSASWFELFYDLTLVATAIKMGGYVHYQLEWGAIGVTQIMFVSIMNAWAALNVYLSRFATECVLLCYCCVCRCNGVAATWLTAAISCTRAGFCCS